MKRKKTLITNIITVFMKEIISTLSILLVSILIVGMFVSNNNSFANTLTFAQISDVHFSTVNSNKSYRLLAESRELLDDAINQVNEVPHLDFVMFTGDMINKPYEKS